jgi:hypothetical protein
MKRSIQNTALAILLGAAGAHAAAQTTTAGVADPQAPVPPTQARSVIDYRTGPAPAMSTPGHDHHAGMDMGGKQCMAGGDKKDMQCMKGDGQCDCCADMKKDGCCCNHKEAK